MLCLYKCSAEISLATDGQLLIPLTEHLRKKKKLKNAKGRSTERVLEQFGEGSYGAVLEREEESQLQL